MGEEPGVWPNYLVLAALYPSSSISAGNVRVSEAHKRSFTCEGIKRLLELVEGIIKAIRVSRRYY